MSEVRIQRLLEPSLENNLNPQLTDLLAQLTHQGSGINYNKERIVRNSTYLLPSFPIK